MGHLHRKSWGSNIMKYCPVNKVCWSISVNANGSGKKLNIYKDMPTYGLERKELPNVKT